EVLSQGRHRDVYVPEPPTVGTRDSDPLSPSASPPRGWPPALGARRARASAGGTPRRASSCPPLLSRPPALEVVRSRPRRATIHEVTLAAMRLSDLRPSVLRP